MLLPQMHGSANEEFCQKRDDMMESDGNVIVKMEYIYAAS